MRRTAPDDRPGLTQALDLEHIRVNLSTSAPIVLSPRSADDNPGQREQDRTCHEGRRECTRLAHELVAHHTRSGRHQAVDERCPSHDRRELRRRDTRAAGRADQPTLERAEQDRCGYTTHEATEEEDGHGWDHDAGAGEDVGDAKGETETTATVLVGPDTDERRGDACREETGDEEEGHEALREFVLFVVERVDVGPLQPVRA